MVCGLLVQIKLLLRRGDKRKKTKNFLSESEEDDPTEKVTRTLEQKSDLTEKDSDLAEESQDLEDSENYLDDLPHVDVLLALPRKTGGKTDDEILDELDADIARKDKEYVKKCLKVDLERKQIQIKFNKWKDWRKENTELGVRLQQELSQAKLSSLLEENLPYIQGIRDGNVPSSRSDDYHHSYKRRFGLYRKASSGPFTLSQTNWVLNHISRRVVEGNSSEDRDYAFKVLLPEVLIKIYMDVLGLERAEADSRMVGTPIEGEEEEDESSLRVYL